MTRSLPSRIIGRLRERKGRRAPRLPAPSAPSPLPSAAPQGAPSTGPVGLPPILIIGTHRSGTSLLRRILDSHSRIACPPESKFVLPLVEVLRDGQAMGGLDSMGYSRQAVVRATAAFAASFFADYAAARGKARWADKTPNYVNVLPELWELFGPDARFLLIFRHGLDVAHSLSDPHRSFPAARASVARWGGPPAVAAGRYWAEQTRKIEAFRAEHPEACHQVRYEDLTTRPEDVLPAMFAFLDEPWEPEVIEYGRFEHDAGFEDPDVRRRRRVVPNSGKYAEWPPELQQAVREACEPLLSRLGYR